MSEYKENKDKINVQERLKDLTEGITKTVQKEKRIIGTDLLSADRMLQLAKETFEGKMKINLEQMKEVYESKISKLEQDVEKFKPKKTTVEFSNGWHVKMDIESVNLAFFLIKTKSSDPRDQCGVCNAFEDMGYLVELENLWKLVNIPKELYKLKIWEVDQADRYLSKGINENYTSRLTPKGLNWYYCKGLGIQKFPAYDLIIHFKSGRIEKKPLHKRLQGIGRKDGELYVFGLIESMVNFFKSNFEGSQLEKTTFRHKKDSIYTDYKMDEKMNK